MIFVHWYKLYLFLFLSCCIRSEHLIENFETTEPFSNRWEISDAIPTHEQGTFERVRNKLTSTVDFGLQTSESLRYYAISRPLKQEMHNLKKTIVMQYSVRFEQKEEPLCAGGYLKLLTSNSNFKPSTFDGDTNYAIMFGPDVCGAPKLHFIVRAEQHVSLAEDVDIENEFTPTTLPMKRTIDYGISETERKRSHIFTLILHGLDNSWEILIDDVSHERGNMTNSFDFLPPLYVVDQEIKKPSDWVDNNMIPVGNGKPNGYDDMPRRIPSPTAKRPELWDDYEDGEWIPPLIPNPHWDGEWEQTFVTNPKYKGTWKRPYIENPIFSGEKAKKRVRDLHYVCNPCTHVGIEIFQMNHGTVFDDILITDSIEEAELGRAMFLRKSKEEMWSQYKVKKEELELELSTEAQDSIVKKERDSKILKEEKVDIDDNVDVDKVKVLEEEEEKKKTVPIENLSNVKDSPNVIPVRVPQTEEEIENEAVLEAMKDAVPLPGFRPQETDETIRARNEERATVPRSRDL